MIILYKKKIKINYKVQFSTTKILKDRFKKKNQLKKQSLSIEPKLGMELLRVGSKPCTGHLRVEP
jgi:hypothetical protein